MNAGDVMTTEIISVSPDTLTRQVAALLLSRGISAVPVVDKAGAPLGMVSEGDLIGNGIRNRDERRDWWLEMLAEGTQLSGDFLDFVEKTSHTARQVMAAPVVVVSEDTPVEEIARILETHHIKRVPVLRDGRIVGIVSRADLVHALANLPQRPEPKPHRLLQHPSMPEGLSRLPPSVPPEAVPPPPIAREPVTAADFRELVEAYKRAKHYLELEAKHEAAIARRNLIDALLREHVTEEAWRAILYHARQAAERGETEFLLLSFPNELCSDGGRKINAPEPDWPATLRGKAADVYDRWDRELRPRGFGLRARVLGFPGGLPSDVGLFLTWAG